MDAETVAELLSVSTRQIRNYVTQGMPSEVQGRTRTFTWPKVLEWYVGYRAALEGGYAGADEDSEDSDGESDAPHGKEDIRAANLRKTRAEADLKQMALSKLRGEMINVADARSLVTRTFSNLRTQLLSMAPKLSTRLAGEPDLSTIESVIREEMETLCRELSVGKIVGGAPEQSDNTDELLSSLSAAADSEILPRVDAFLQSLEGSVQKFLEDHAPLEL